MTFIKVKVIQTKPTGKKGYLILKEFQDIKIGGGGGGGLFLEKK